MKKGMTKAKKQLKKELIAVEENLDKMDWSDIGNFGWLLVSMALDEENGVSSTVKIYKDNDDAQLKMEGLAVRYKRSKKK